jgi:hypothetical protein
LGWTARVTMHIPRRLSDDFVTVWDLINQPFALRSPAIETGHLGGGDGFIDEDKLFRVKGWLFFPPGLTGGDDIFTILFGGVHALF